jgi:hypothetical protein
VVLTPGERTVVLFNSHLHLSKFPSFKKTTEQKVTFNVKIAGKVNNAYLEK